MLSTRRFSPEGSITLGSTTKIATHLLLISALAVSVCCLFSAPTLAQGSLSPGYQSLIFGGNIPGIDAVTYDMIGYHVNGANITAQCVRRPH